MSGNAQRSGEALRSAGLPYHKATLWREHPPGYSTPDCPQATGGGEEPYEHGHDVGTVEPACHRRVSCHPHAERVDGGELEHSRGIVQGSLTKPQFVLVG